MMLRPAQLYKEQIEQIQYEAWYDLDNQYWNCSCWDDRIEIQESNYGVHQFVSVDRANNILGYITYAIDQQTQKATGWGIISFRKGNPIFAADLYTCIYNIFYKFGLNKIEFYAYTDNPVIRSYERFIDKVGGVRCGIQRQTAMLMDHKLHDGATFEILKEEFRPLKNWRFIEKAGGKE